MSLLLAFTLAFALAQSPATSSTGAISGQVVEETTQSPIAGAQVTLFPDRRQSGASPFHEQPEMRVSDRDGRFTFEGVEPGRYRVTVRRAGFTRPNEMTSGPPETVVQPGQRAVVNVTLQRGAVIAGRVVDEDGQPVVDANVMPMRRLPSGRGNAPIRRLVPAGTNAQTNDLGEFRLHSLPAGEYYVMATPHGGFTSSGAGAKKTIATYFPDTADEPAAQPVNVGVGQTVGDIEIRMASAPAFSVSGVVVDENGRPAADAMVTMTVENANSGFRFRGDSYSARTDAAGAFTIGGATPGAYTLLAMAPVVIARTPARTGTGGEAWIAMGGGSIGGVTGAGGSVTTESRNGTTVQYRSDQGTRVPVVVSHADISGLEVIVRRPAR